jgi:hypothetical protein
MLVGQVEHLSMVYSEVIFIGYGWFLPTSSDRVSPESLSSTLFDIGMLLFTTGILKGCSRGGRGIMEDMCSVTRDDKPRPVWTSLPMTC